MPDNLEMPQDLGIIRAANMRPIVPLNVRDIMPPPAANAPANPFVAVQEANKESQQLVERLQILAEKLTGSSPAYAAKKEPDPKDGLLQLSAAVARLIAERSRHGVSLIDKIEENLR